jgi:hypothetical protein
MVQAILLLLGQQPAVLAMLLTNRCRWHHTTTP